MSGGLYSSIKKEQRRQRSKVIWTVVACVAVLSLIVWGIASYSPVYRNSLKQAVEESVGKVNELQMQIAEKDAQISALQRELDDLKLLKKSLPPDETDIEPPESIVRTTPDPSPEPTKEPPAATTSRTTVPKVTPSTPKTTAGPVVPPDVVEGTVR